MAGGCVRPLGRTTFDLILTWIVLLLVLTLDPTYSQQSDHVISYEILEEQPANSLIGNLIADAMLDAKYTPDVLTQLRFNFLTQNSLYKEYFVVEERTGLFRTQKTLDRDIMCSYEPECVILLDVAVQPVEFFQIIKLSIKVIDINDNYPTFPEARVSLSISETTSPGASFAIPGADDADTGAFTVQSYHLVASNTNAFELRTTGETEGNTDLQLVLKDKLDREVRDSFSLKVIAKDGGIPEKTGTVIVDITVVDANDNNPHFINHTYEVYVFENLPTGSVILTVKAEDQDEGENGQITYDFSRATKNMLGYLFGINGETGEIYTRDEVDYEENTQYTLGIVAKDQGPNALADYAKVVIHVWDVNDHAPQITVNALSESGVAQIEEGSEEDAFVAHISVVDPDGGINGEFTCMLDNPKFKLVQLFSTEYKIVSAHVFDREAQDRYDAMLTCKDNGQIAQMSTLQLRIEVTDANDHQPRFTSDYYSVSLRENNAMNEFMTQVNATDEDIGINAQITYSVIGERSDLLKVDPKTGMIVANGVFDYETKSEFSFTVVATDNGDPELSASAILTVTVLDINDEVPKFSQPTYSFGTYENQASGTEIGTVEAFDSDSAPFNIIIYSFDYTKGDVGVFKIDPHTGKITTRKVLDREERDSYSVIVIARNDGFLLSSTVNVTIFVADQNDNSPIITFPHGRNNTVQVSTFGAAGDIVTHIEAYDLDIASNAQLRYSILGGSGQDLFVINQHSGQVTIEDDLVAFADRTLLVTILVQDSGDMPLSTLSDLYIHINSSLVPVTARHSGNDLSETNLVVIICLSIIAVVLLVFVLLVILVFKRRRRSLCRRQAHKPNCTCSKCQMAKYVQYQETEHVPSGGLYKDCTYVRGESVSPDSAENGGFNGNGVYLQMEPRELEVEHKKPNIFETIFGSSNRRSGNVDKHKLNKKRKVHFADGEHQANKAYQAVSSTSSSPSKSPLHEPSGAGPTPDLLQQYTPVQGRCKEEKLGAGKQAKDVNNGGWLMEEQRNRLLYRQPPPQQNSGPKQLMPLQVQSLLNTTPPDDTSDHGSSCDSGRGPSEEEPDHSRHSNNLSDPCLYPAPVPTTENNPNIQHLHCSCKPNTSNGVSTFTNNPNSQRPSSALSYNKQIPTTPFQRTASFQDREPIWSTSSPSHSPVKTSSSISPTKKCACPHDLEKCVKVAPPPPRRSSTLMTSKPLPDLPVKEYNPHDHESADGDSEGESTTTSGSYMVDAMLDLSGDGPQISPCDVFV